MNFQMQPIWFIHFFAACPSKTPLWEWSISAPIFFLKLFPRLSVQLQFQSNHLWKLLRPFQKEMTSGDAYLVGYCHLIQTGRILLALCICMPPTRQEDSGGQEPILRKYEHLQPRAVVTQEEREARLVVVAYACNPRTGEAETGRSLKLTDQSVWPNWQATGQWISLSQKKWTSVWRAIPKADLCPLWECVDMYVPTTYTCSYVHRDYA